MDSFNKYQVVPTRNSDKLYVKAHSKKEALEKLVEYTRKERNYSEKEIEKFIAESVIEKVNC
jgi:hypothetical protein